MGTSVCVNLDILKIQMDFVRLVMPRVKLALDRLRQNAILVVIL